VRGQSNGKKTLFRNRSTWWLDRTTIELTAGPLWILLSESDCKLPAALPASYVRPASGVYKSQVEVPGEETKFMAFRDVPHGVLNEHLYINKENGTARRVVIYTPPGYGANDK
jgi:hypothetical protein